MTRAVAATKLDQMATVSLCMIVRNEERHLADCLACCADLVDEIVIIDTGSTDRTKQIAAAARDKHGQPAKVFDFAWVDDFAAARNESLRHATGDWIFWMDADERLLPDSQQALARLFGEIGDELAAYAMPQVSQHRNQPNSVVMQLRLWRNQPAIRWTGRIHEQTLPSVLACNCELRRIEAPIGHIGYFDLQVLHQKRLRNLSLLKLESEERPDNPAILFYLGCSSLNAGQEEEAMRCFERSREILAGDWRPFSHELLGSLGAIYARRRQFCQLERIEAELAAIGNLEANAALRRLQQQYPEHQRR